MDTHALLWWLEGNGRLSQSAEDAIGDPEADIFVSAASVWEICTKVRIGRLPEAAAFAADSSARIAKEGFVELPVTVQHGQLAGNLPAAHADPFDRMLAAQAILEGLTLVSADKALDGFGVTRLW